MANPTSLLLLGQQLKHRYGALCRDVEAAYGLTRNEIDVLLFLSNNPGYDTARDVVELRGLSKSHVCKSVDALTRRGWLEGTQDPRDRRCIHLRLRPAAGEAVEAARQVQAQFLARLYDGVTDEERAMLGGILAKIADNLRR